MTVLTYHQPVQAHYGSPTLHPLHRQQKSIHHKSTHHKSTPTPFRSLPAAAAVGMASPASPTSSTSSRRSHRRRRRTPSPRKPDLDAPRKHIFVVTGPAGCGKTTIATDLAARLGYAYIEGDDFHTPEAVETMSKGIKLTDQYRWDWLITLREQCLKVLSHPPASAVDPSVPPSASESAYNQPQTAAPPVHSPSAPPPSSPPEGVVLTCSALKRKYRDEFRVASHPIHAGSTDLRIYFIYCDISEAESKRRVASRVGHFMKAAAVHDQFVTLERPDELELGEDSLRVDVSGTKEQVRNLVWSGVQGRLEEEEREDDGASSSGGDGWRSDGS